jgi:hypothetical protein
VKSDRISRKLSKNEWFYAVAKGFRTGIFYERNLAHHFVTNYKGACHKKYNNIEAAVNFMLTLSDPLTTPRRLRADDRVRADPLTGHIWCIFVSGNFRQAFNLIGIIRGSGAQPPTADALQHRHVQET